MENNDLPMLSSITNLKYFTKQLTESEIIDIQSDFKHRIFPRPFERLSSLRNRTRGGGLVGVEIGVAGGEHALSLLETLNVKRLYLVDPYELYAEYSEGKLHYGINQLSLSESEIRCKSKLQAFERHVIWIKKVSTEAIEEIDESVDFVYIDGNHQYEFVKQDIAEYFRLLNVCGVIGGHDYYNGFQREHDGVVRAVTEFIGKTKFELRVEMPDWWVET
jgi:hypothetical protein